jgi:hypothetical protein
MRPKKTQMKQTYPISVSLLRILVVTACLVVTLIMAPLPWISDVYAIEIDESGEVSSGAQQTGGILPVPDYSGDLRNRPALTGDWGGLRQQLVQLFLFKGFVPRLRSAPCPPEKSQAEVPEKWPMIL